MNFFIFYLAAPQSSLGHFRENSLTHSMLISAFNLYLTRWFSGASFCKKLRKCFNGKEKYAKPMVKENAEKNNI